jgi:YgiT-type zinc finger domain-containing protein
MKIVSTFIKGVYRSVADFEFCCTPMMEYYEGLFVFGDVQEHMFATTQEDAKVHMLIERTYTGEIEIENIPINFCPFCGERIEMEYV